jgi:NADH-quinone oxidoreductase subunit J
MADKLFYFLSFLALLSALMVVFSKNPVHSVLYLILTFFSLSGHYVLLNAQFLAAVNIIVYAGAIMVLFLFTIMFLNLREGNAEGRRAVYMRFAAIISGSLLGIILIAAFSRLEVSGVGGYNFNNQIGLVERLGQVLYADFLLPFELTSVLFLSAMVGAILLGARDEGEANTF